MNLEIGLVSPLRGFYLINRGIICWDRQHEQKPTRACRALLNNRVKYAQALRRPAIHNELQRKPGRYALWGRTSLG